MGAQRKTPLKIKIICGTLGRRPTSLHDQAEVVCRKHLPTHSLTTAAITLKNSYHTVQSRKKSQEDAVARCVLLLYLQKLYVLRRNDK